MSRINQTAYLILEFSTAGSYDVEHLGQSGDLVETLCTYVTLWYL